MQILIFSKNYLILNERSRNMKILVTGSNGFIGKHICRVLEKRKHIVLKYDKENSFEDLEKFICSCDWIVHLAGSMRPVSKEDYYVSNSELTKTITELIEKHDASPSIIFASSTQSSLNNDYGVSKLQAENYLFELQRTSNCNVAVFRLTNAFGKWGKPNYNSVVSTFCYNISHDLPIRIDDGSKVINFIYIDDIVRTFVGVIEGTQSFKRNNFNSVEPYYPISIGDLANKLYSFREYRQNLQTPNLENEFDKKLFATFLSYYSIDSLSYVNADDANSQCNLFACGNHFGNVSIETIKPGEEKWKHFHETMAHRITILVGQCSILLKEVNGGAQFEYYLNAKDKKYIDIPPGIIHSIQNKGNDDCIVLVWNSACNFEDTIDL